MASVAADSRVALPWRRLVVKAKTKDNGNGRGGEGRDELAGFDHSALPRINRQDQSCFHVYGGHDATRKNSGIVRRTMTSRIFAAAAAGGRRRKAATNDLDARVGQPKPARQATCRGRHAVPAGI
jgi:hypothetical protein